MNCPFKKNHSRILSLILVLTLLLGTLTGCLGSKEDETEDTSTPAPNINLIDQTTPSDPEDTTESTDPAGSNIAVITQQVAVRSAPASDGKPIGYLDAGTEVEIIRIEKMNEVEWALIREGWVPMANIDTNYTPSATEPDETTPDETTPEETTPNNGTTAETDIKGVVTATTLYIRKEASKDSEEVGSYAKGAVITILETKNGWGRTNKGWVSMTYVKTSADGTETPTTNPNNNNNNNTNNNTTTNTTTSGKKAVVTVDDLNIRKEATKNSDRVGSYTYGDRITILETSNGWGRTDKGWISLSYVYQDGDTGSKSCKGIVTGTTLNVRSGPGTNYDKVKSLSSGDRVTVLERLTINGTTWGCTSSGWISMDYVYVDGTTGTGSGTGTITGDNLNIRSGPGTNYNSVGKLNSGDTVEILAQFTIGDTTWGCISKGWISMDYVEMDE